MKEMVGIDVKEVLHMNEGDGETSYAKASYIQKQALSLSKSIKEQAIQEFYKKQENTTSPKCVWIADFGCSSVKLNKTSAIYELITIVEKTCKKMGKKSPMQYQIALNDLPNNDFNTIFKSLSRFQDLVKEKTGDNFGHCFVGACPGSFYGRLFPPNILHIVHSSFSLHWLSQVPRGIDENKENIVIGRTSTPLVIKAYSDQFRNDFLTFLRCRSEEMVPQGVMALTMMGRKDEESYDKASSQVYHLMALVLNDMVKEGYIKEEEVNKFNFPVYEPSLKELKHLVQIEGSFTLTNIQVNEIDWISKEYDEYDFTKCIRSVFEPLLTNHFGNLVIDQVFERYQKLVHISLTTQRNAICTLSIALSKRNKVVQTKTDKS